VHAQETSCIQGEPRSRRNLGGHRGWTNKRQKTHHVGSSNDKLTTGYSAIPTHPKTDYTPSKGPRVSSIEQGGTTIAIPQRGQNFVHEPVVSEVVQRWESNTWPGITQAGEFDTEIRDTRRPRLFDDRSRFQNVKDRPMLFPTNPEWFHLGSYTTPLVGDARQLAPLVEWSSPPMGRLGADGERMPCDTTGHNLPVVTSAATRRLGKTYVVNTYEGATCDSVPLWINPPAVVQLQEAVNDEQRPHPEQSQERFQEYSQPDDRCEENPDRWSRRREKTMTGGVRSGA
jgi:hypothetical protein